MSRRKRSLPLARPAASALSRPAASALNQPAASALNQPAASALSRPAASVPSRPAASALSQLSQPAASALNQPAASALNQPAASALSQLSQPAASAPERPPPGALERTTRYSPAVLEGIADGERAALALSLAKRTEAGVIEAASAALARAEALAEASAAVEPPERPIACKAGCSACCVSKVLVLAPEVVRIAAHLRATRGEAALAALLERVRATDAATRGLSRLERAEARIPCPLLDERGACSVHAVRPIVCAAWSSLDAAACERHFEAPASVPTAPMHRPGYEVANAVLAGLGWAARELGLEAVPLELIAALRIALERPTAAERWLARLPVFAAARDAEWQGAHQRDG